MVGFICVSFVKVQGSWVWGNWNGVGVTGRNIGVGVGKGVGNISGVDL
ncbi:MAG: hypothetical protein CM1200mP35_10240 [Chloroflexota bacterium]|nr:MAG: hypothetical protein CM1200mP35_10240 [Chloroflexota bacterium]